MLVQAVVKILQEAEEVYKGGVIANRLNALPKRIS